MFKNLIKAVISAIPKAVKAVKNAAKKMAKKVTEAVEKVKETVEELKEDIEEAIGKVFTEARKIAKKLTSNFVANLKKGMNAVIAAGKKFSKAAKKIGSIMVKGLKKFGNWIKDGGWRELTSFGIDLIPVVGNIKAGIEFIIGYDIITFKKLSGAERVLAGASILGGPLVKGTVKGAKYGLNLVKSVDSAIDVTKGVTKGVTEGVTKGATKGTNIAKGLSELGKKFVNHISQNIDNAVKSVRSKLESLGAKIGNIKIPTKVNVGALDTGTGIKVPVLHVAETKTVKDIYQNFTGKGTAKGTDKPNLGKLTYNNGTWTSSGGLIYGPDKKFGNRVQHVLAHTEPNPNKVNHTIFNVDKTEVLKVVDEAWSKKGAPLANDPGTYVVPMGRVIGTNGETAVRLVVKPGTNEIITAYPVVP